MQRVPIQPVQNVEEARRRNIELDRAHEMADFQVRRQEWASGQMPEHRARGLDRNGKPLVLRPIDSNRAFGAPEAGMLVIGSLNDNKLTYTMSDGHLGEVEISAASVEAAQTAIQQVIDSLPWRGRAHTVPT
jgi:hypothetical protein